jgi:hypothetical protein
MIRARYFACALALVAAAACAVRPGVNPAPDVVTPPRPLGSSRPALIAPAADTIYSAELAVDVDQQGVADLSTLQLKGSVGESNRGVISQWLRTTRFEPARRNGAPVRARFNMAADALLSVDPATTQADSLTPGETDACQAIALAARRLPGARVTQGLDSFPAFTGRTRRYGCVVGVRGPVRSTGRVPVMATTLPDSLGAGWRRDDAVVADGPARTVYGLWHGDVLCLVRVDWGAKGNAGQPRRAGTAYDAEVGCEELPGRVVPRE